MTQPNAPYDRVPCIDTYDKDLSSIGRRTRGVLTAAFDAWLKFGEDDIHVTVYDGEIVAAQLGTSGVPPEEFAARLWRHGWDWKEFA